MRRLACVVFALSISACRSFDDDFAAYCAARGPLTIGETCGEGVSCCEPYQCEAARCCAPVATACTDSSQCCNGLSCVDGACSTASVVVDAGRDSGVVVDAGTDAGVIDAGVPDAGEPDAGSSDAGTDAGFDAGTDAGVPPFDAGALDGVVFLTPPRSTVAGACSPVIEVGVFVDGGYADGGAQLFFITGEEAATLHLDDQCAGPPAYDAIVPANERVQLYAFNTLASTMLITASIDDPPHVAQQVQRFTPAPAVRLGFGSPIPFVVSNGCSEVVRVLLRDQFGNVSPAASAYDVTVTAGGTARVFAETDSTCASPATSRVLRVAAGASSVAFRFSDSSPGTPSFDAWVGDAGVALDGGPLPGSLIPAHFDP